MTKGKAYRKSRAEFFEHTPRTPYCKRHGDPWEVVEYAPHRRMMLAKVDCWVQYSDRARYIDRKALVIKDRDTDQFHCIRVSPQCVDIDEAIEWLKPAEAQRAGRKARRQGDVYYIPAKRRWNLDAAPTSHRPVVWRHAGRSGARYWEKYSSPENGDVVIMEHDEHPPIVLDKPHKALRQKSTVGGRVDAAD